MSNFIKDETVIDDYINTDYLRKEGIKLFKLDVLPPGLKHFLNKEERDKVSDFINECSVGKVEHPNYYEYRCKTYGNSVEHNIKYEWSVLLKYIEKHPEHSELLKKGGR